MISDSAKWLLPTLPSPALPSLAGMALDGATMPVEASQGQGLGTMPFDAPSALPQFRWQPALPAVRQFNPNLPLPSNALRPSFAPNV